MDRKTAEKIVEDYEALTAKAVEILNSDGPPGGYVSNSEWARVAFDGDYAVVSHPHVSADDDSVSIEIKTERFPSALLFMSPTDLGAWKKDAAEKYDKERAREKVRRQAAAEAAERALLEALKRKFEN